MNTLKRTDYTADGIFSEFTLDGEDKPFCVCLSHGYEQNDGSYLPVIPPGQYKCVRGMHQLDNGMKFETFEVMGVFGHHGLLFHWGNYNRDSKGCELVGQNRMNGMITNSIATFKAFMACFEGVNQWDLEVIE